MEENKEKELKWKLERLKSILDRWDKPVYTTDNQPMRAMIAEMRMIFEENAQ